MIPGEGMTTQELFKATADKLKTLEKLMTGRKQRDKACVTLTDLYVLIEGLARRLQQVEFSGGPVSHDDEDDDKRPEAVEPMTMAELIDMPADELELNEAERAGIEVRELRLRYFRQFIDYHVKGCVTVDEVLRKLLAFARRFRPESMREFGLSMSDVGRKWGKSRANIHAGEKRLVEDLLKQGGAKGFHGLGGQRSERHRQKCRQAQKGNKNRLKGESRKRDEAA